MGRGQEEEAEAPPETQVVTRNWRSGVRGPSVPCESCGRRGEPGWTCGDHTHDLCHYCAGRTALRVRHLKHGCGGDIQAAVALLVMGDA